MCRYCKNLRKIKDLDSSRYQKIIRKWRYHSAKQDRLLSEALDYLDLYTKNGSLSDDDFFSAIDLCWRIKYFFQNDWIGK